MYLWRKALDLSLTLNLSNASFTTPPYLIFIGDEREGGYCLRVEVEVSQQFPSWRS